MTRQELREWVWNRWGARLERPSLDELREGIVELQALASPPPEDKVFVLDDVASDYETAMREFFGQTLAGPEDEALVQLWITGLELWLALMTREERSGG